MEEVMLEIKNVTKTYRPKKGVPVKALDNVSLKFEDKGMVFILGKSGSGKSTFLRCLNRLEEITAGEVVIDGVNIAEKKVDLLAANELYRL